MSHALFSTEFIVAWICVWKNCRILDIIPSAYENNFLWKNVFSFYLHKYILVQLAPKVNPSNDGNRLAYEMSSFQTNVHHPPFWYCYVWFHDSAGRRDSRDSIQVRVTRYGIIIHFYTFSRFNPS